MWNYTLPLFNESFYGVALWFLTYSVMGWIVESIYISLCNKKITNRGYIKGPMFCRKLYINFSRWINFGYNCRIYYCYSNDKIIWMPVVGLHKQTF